MYDRLVICSSPVDDNLMGQKHNADYVNLAEYDWDQLSSKVKNYKNIILEHNSKNERDLHYLILFANLNNLPAPVAKQNFCVNKEFDRIIDKNQILFLGCSHTYGKGHSTSDTVYTHQLCKLLNYKPLVDAQPGGNNMLIEEKLQTYNLKNSRVVLQFTDMYRLQLNGIRLSGKDYTLSHNNVFTDEILACEFVERVKRIVKLLRSNDSKFLFFQLSHSYPYQSEVLSILSQYEEFVFIRDWNIDTGDLGHHSGVKSHRLWAEKLFNSRLLE